jgi:hypothetical protein
LLEESIAVARDVGNPVRLAAGLTNFGQLESAAGDFDRAIRLRQHLVPREHRGTAGRDHRRARRPAARRPGRAARLAGAAESIRQQFGLPTTDLEAARIEQYLALSRAAVTPEAWAAELAAGQALTQPEAIALLLSPGPLSDLPD